MALRKLVTRIAPSDKIIYGSQYQDHGLLVVEYTLYLIITYKVTTYWPQVQVSTKSLMKANKDFNDRINRPTSDRRLNMDGHCLLSEASHYY